MQQSHHQGIFPGSPRSRVCRFVPVLSPVRKNIFAVPSSRFITVGPGRHTSTPGLINQDHPGGQPFHPGGHPVHPGRHPVHPGQHTVDTRFIPVNTRFITVPYGSLRCLMVHYGSSRSTHGSLRLITVHYGNSDHPGEHQVYYGSLRFIPVNTRFFQVNTRFEFSPRFDAGSTELCRYFPRFNPVHHGPEFAGSSRYCPRLAKIYLQSHHHGSLRFAPVNTRQHPV